jgi:3-oxoacyl-[acyl-carrier protein] reductase
MDLSARVAIVTGSGRGIGREIALVLAEHGARVVVSDIDAAMAEQAAAEIEGGGKSIAVAADITVQEQVTNLVDQTLAAFGQVDILVNNAGITRDTLLMRMSASEWDQVLTTNLKGAFLCTQPVVRHMLKQRWGGIVNIASVVGLIGNAGQAN